MMMMNRTTAEVMGPLLAAQLLSLIAHRYGVQYIVRAGDWYLDGTLKREFLPPQEREVVNIEVHPFFSSKTLENNIALLKLASNFVYDDHIRPICLADWNSHYDPGNCVVIGWGKDSAGENFNQVFIIHFTEVQYTHTQYHNLVYKVCTSLILKNLRLQCFKYKTNFCRQKVLFCCFICGRQSWKISHFIFQSNEYKVLVQAMLILCV